MRSFCAFLASSMASFRAKGKARSRRIFYHSRLQTCKIGVYRSVGFPLLTGCRGGAPAPKPPARGVGGGLERPDARGSARRFPIEKLLQNITNSITTRKFSCTFRCAPRRSRPVSLRLGHAAALDATGIHSLPRRRFATSGLPATVFGSGGFAPRPPLAEETQQTDKLQFYNFAIA